MAALFGMADRMSLGEAMFDPAGLLDYVDHKFLVAVAAMGVIMAATTADGYLVSLALAIVVGILLMKRHEGEAGCLSYAAVEQRRPRNPPLEKVKKGESVIQFSNFRRLTQASCNNFCANLTGFSVKQENEEPD